MNKALNNAVKKLDDYKQSKPEQLELFCFSKLEDRPYSNTIELYDAIPKYYWGKVTRIEGTFLNALHRKFKHKGQGYNVMIAPARIIDRKGQEKDCYPGLREELVEDALRKLACGGQGVFLEDREEKINQAGVVFSLYEIQQELKNNGHEYNIAQIKDSLFICGSSTLTVKSDDGKSILMSNIFETVGLQTQEDWKGHGKKTQAFVRFNSLVTGSIKNKTFRQLNYDKCMAYKTILSRWLHKRMSHNFIQASMMNNYEIFLSTVIRDSGVKRYARFKNNISEVKKALEEMKKVNVLREYSINLIYDTNRKNKIVDAKLTLFPDLSFIRELKLANKRFNFVQ